MMRLASLLAFPALAAAAACAPATRPTAPAPDTAGDHFLLEPAEITSRMTSHHNPPTTTWINGELTIRGERARVALYIANDSGRGPCALDENGARRHPFHACSDAPLIGLGARRSTVELAGTAVRRDGKLAIAASDPRDTRRSIALDCTPDPARMACAIASAAIPELGSVDAERPPALAFTRASQRALASDAASAAGRYRIEAVTVHVRPDPKAAPRTIELTGWLDLTGDKADLLLEVGPRDLRLAGPVTRRDGRLALELAASGERVALACTPWSADGLACSADVDLAETRPASGSIDVLFKRMPQPITR